MSNDNVIKITNENMKLTVDSKDNIAFSPNYDIDKVYIWGYELCKSSEWNDFLEIVNKLGEKNSELRKQLEASETQNKRVLEKLELITKSNQELQKQLEEKEKDNQFLKKMYLSEKQKNDNYRSEKYGLDKPVEELRKIKLNPKEKEIYYKGFDNCERQFATHIAELQQQLKSQPEEIVEKIRKELAINGDDYCEIRECTSSHTNCQYSWFNYVRFRDYLDTILEEYQK